MTPPNDTLERLVWLDSKTGESDVQERLAYYHANNIQYSLEQFERLVRGPLALLEEPKP